MLKLTVTNTASLKFHRLQYNTSISPNNFSHRFLFAAPNSPRKSTTSFNEKIPNRNVTAVCNGTDKVDVNTACTQIAEEDEEKKIL